MTEQTENILQTILNSDHDITPAEKESVMSILRRKKSAEGPPPVEAIYTRNEAAAILKKTPAMVDYYARLGLLKKIKFGAASRASGIEATSLRDLLEGRTALPTS